MFTALIATKNPSSQSLALCSHTPDRLQPSSNFSAKFLQDGSFGLVLGNREFQLILGSGPKTPKKLPDGYRQRPVLLGAGKGSNRFYNGMSSAEVS